MKKLVILSVICGILFSCHENEKKMAASDVPSQVTTSFNTRYPNATEVEWEQEKEDGKIIYESEFKFNGKKIEAEFDSTGNFLKED